MKKVLILCMLAALGTLTQAAHVTNGDFENTSGTFPTGWTVSGAVDQETTTPLSDLVSADVTIGASITQDFISSGSGLDNLAGWTLNFMISFDNLTGNERLRLRADGNSGDIITMRFQTTGVSKYSSAWGWNQGIAQTLTADTPYYVRVICGNLDADANPEFQYGVSTDGVNFSMSGISGAFHTSSSFVLANPFETIRFEGGNDGGMLLDNIVVVQGTWSETAQIDNPEDGIANVTVEAQLNWLAPNAYDPVYYDVLFGTEPNILNSNYDMEKILTAQDVLTADPALHSSLATEMNYDTTYYWQVDAYEPNTVPIKHEGDLWSFTTAPPTPFITVDPPRDVVGIGESAELVVSADNATSYEWYKVVVDGPNTLLDDATDTKYVGEDSNSLTILDVDVSDEAFYYCVAINTAGSDQSADGAVGVKRPLSQWKFDQTTDSPGVYTDSIGSNDGIMENAAFVRTYTTGADGTDNGAILINDPNCVANAGTWDPSEYTNQITVAAWVNWNGPGGRQGVVGKADAWDTTNKWLWRTVNNGASLQWFRNNSYGPGITLTDDAAWQFIVMTVANGTATSYVNGIQDGTSGFTFGNGDSDVIWLGMAENNTNRRFDGAIDDLRIYNYALAPNEVIDLYNANPILDDVADCIYPDRINEALDLVDDCKINLLDFVEFAAGWLGCGLYPESACH